MYIDLRNYVLISEDVVCLVSIMTADTVCEVPSHFVPSSAAFVSSFKEETVTREMGVNGG